MIICSFFFRQTDLPDAIKLSRQGHPTIGYAKANAHIVVFEEPKCFNCRIFNEQVMPTIKREYIDKNKATYTVIPVSFLPGSMPAALALLCVYLSDPLDPNSELFFTYLDYMYKHQPDESQDWATTDLLVEFAEKASPAINIKQLRRCIDKAAYRKKVRKNTDYGTKVMGGELLTPTVYVNGIEVKDLTIDNMREILDQVLESGGQK